MTTVSGLGEVPKFSKNDLGIIARVFSKGQKEMGEDIPKPRAQL